MVFIKIQRSNYFSEKCFLRKITFSNNAQLEICNNIKLAYLKQNDITLHYKAKNTLLVKLTNLKKKL